MLSQEDIEYCEKNSGRDFVIIMFCWISIMAGIILLFLLADWPNKG